MSKVASVERHPSVKVLVYPAGFNHAAHGCLGCLGLAGRCTAAVEFEAQLVVVRLADGRTVAAVVKAAATEAEILAELTAPATTRPRDPLEGAEVL